MSSIINIPTPKKRKLSKRSRMILGVIMVVILIGAVGAGIYFFYENRNEPSTLDPAAEDKKYEVAHQNASDIINKADSSVSSGDAAGVIKVYDESIEKVSDSYERAILYYNKAMALEQIGDKEAALSAALEASKTDTDQKLGISADALVANIAYELDKKAIALEYYKKQRDYIQSGMFNDIGDPLPGIEGRIVELEGEGV